MKSTGPGYQDFSPKATLDSREPKSRELLEARSRK